MDASQSAEAGTLTSDDAGKDRQPVAEAKPVLTSQTSWPEVRNSVIFFLVLDCVFCFGFVYKVCLCVFCVFVTLCLCSFLCDL